jgi:uncharacterized protein YecE (DUF72 family)
VLLQFPPSFHAEPDAAAYVAWLAGALGDYQLAVEFRHRSWSDAAAETQALLAEARAAWAYIDEPKFEGSIQQDLDAIASRAAGVDHAYVRLHGRKASTWWAHTETEDRYDYLYSAADLQPVARTAAAAAAGGVRVRVHFNNHFSAKAVANAALLRHQLGDLVPGTYPGEMVRRYPELEGIVATGDLPL